MTGPGTSTTHEGCVAAARVVQLEEAILAHIKKGHDFCRELEKTLGHAPAARQSARRPPAIPVCRRIIEHEVDGVPNVKIAVREVDIDAVPVEYEIMHDLVPGKDGSLGETALRIRFQHGSVEGLGLNGVTSESLIAVVVDRVMFAQTTDRCRQNIMALGKLHEALMWLMERSRIRAAEGANVPGPADG